MLRFLSESMRASRVRVMWCVRACVRVHVAAERVLGEGGSIVAKMIVVDADDDVDATALLGVGGGAADGAGTTGRGKEPPLGRFRVLRPTVRPHALPAGSRLRTAPASHPVYASDEICAALL